MKKSKFTESQIVFALRQAESGVTVAEVSKLGISESDVYAWKKKYSGLGRLSCSVCGSWKKRTRS